MTTVCGGATSSGNSSFENNVTFTATAIAAFLDRFIPHELAAFVSPFISGISVVIDAYCSVDPPESPTLDATDFANLLPVAPATDQIAAQNKLRQWFLAQYWCTACKCDDGTIPDCTGTTLPSAPAGANTGLPSGGGSSLTCWTIDNAVQFVPPSGGPPDVDLSAFYIPTNLGTVSVDTSGTSFDGSLAYLIPSSASVIRFTTTSTSPTPSSHDTWLAQFNAAGTLIAADRTERQSTGGGQQDIVVSVASGAASWFVHCIALGTAVTTNVQIHTDLVCAGGTTTDLVQPCCPPDDSLALKLESILSVVQQIWTALPVRIPAYAAGTTHSGLSGNGNQGVDDTCLAIKVQVTELPDVYSEVTGFPNAYFEIGWISPITNEGPQAGVPLRYTTQVLELPPATVSVDYSLPHGEEISIQELQAG